MVRADSAHQPHSSAKFSVRADLKLRSCSLPLLQPILRVLFVSAEFLLSDEFRFYTGVTAILVDTCACARFDLVCNNTLFPLLRVSVLSAGENNSLATWELTRA